MKWFFQNQLSNLAGRLGYEAAERVTDLAAQKTFRAAFGSRLDAGSEAARTEIKFRVPGPVATVGDALLAAVAPAGAEPTLRPAWWVRLDQRPYHIDFGYSSTQADIFHVVLDIPPTAAATGAEGSFLVHFWNPTAGAVTGVTPLVEIQETFEKVIWSLGGETMRVQHG